MWSDAVISHTPPICTLIINARALIMRFGTVKVANAAAGKKIQSPPAGIFAYNQPELIADNRKITAA